MSRDARGILDPETTSVEVARWVAESVLGSLADGAEEVAQDLLNSFNGLPERHPDKHSPVPRETVQHVCRVLAVVFRERMSEMSRGFREGDPESLEAARALIEHARAQLTSGAASYEEIAEAALARKN